MFSIRFSHSDQAFECSEQMSLLIAMARTGQKLIPVGCRAGGCGVCKIRVLEGEYTTRTMSRAQVSKQELTDGYVLACRTYPRSNMLVQLAK